MTQIDDILDFLNVEMPKRPIANDPTDFSVIVRQDHVNPKQMQPLVIPASSMLSRLASGDILARTFAEVLSDIGAAPAATALVAAAVIADHAIVRGDGGARGVQDSTPTIADDGVLSVPGIGDGGYTSYDLRVGNVTAPDFGLIQIGNSAIGRIDFEAGAVNLRGACFWRNIGGPTTGDIEFILCESTGDDARLAIPKSGAGLHTYHPRSLICAGPAPADTDFVKISYWQGQGLFHNLICDTVGSGAEFGVQGNVEFEETLFCDTFAESTTDARITFSSAVIINHTATEADDHALELDVDAAGYGDVKAFDIDYVTGNISTGEDEGVFLLNVDHIDATGGDVFGIEILATEGGAAIYGIKTGVGIGPIHQDTGTFVNPTTGTDNTPSTDVPAMIDGSTGTTTAIFENDNEYIIIGAAAAFEELELVFTADASVSIKPTFWYSIAGTGQFTQFTPVDGTDGCKKTGVIAWDASDLTGHVADDVTGTFDIKIIRTKNNMTTTPILGYAKTATTTEYIWDKDGKITINNLEAFTKIITPEVESSGALLLEALGGNITLDVPLGSDTAIVMTNSGAGDISLNVPTIKTPDAFAFDIHALGGTTLSIANSTGGQVCNVTLDGSLSLADSQELKFGAGTDFKVWSDGTLGRTQGQLILGQSKADLIGLHGTAVNANFFIHFDVTSTTGKPSRVFRGAFEYGPAITSEDFAAVLDFTVTNDSTIDTRTVRAKAIRKKDSSVNDSGFYSDVSLNSGSTFTGTHLLYGYRFVSTNATPTVTAATVKMYGCHVGPEPTGYTGASSWEYYAYYSHEGICHFNDDGGDYDFIIEGSGDASLFNLDAGLDIITVGGSGTTAKFNVDQNDSTARLAVLSLDQADIDDRFVDFVGTSAADGSRSISSDTTEDSAKFGAVRVNINGVLKWVRVYDNES